MKALRLFFLTIFSGPMFIPCPMSTLAVWSPKNFPFANSIFTLEFGIEVSPTLINLAFFSRAYGLIRDYIKVIKMVIYYIGHVYLRPYVYSFCQIFQALRLFPALRPLRTLE